MTVREMHYDFKQKLNKIDSQKNRDLYVPEIDWKLNEAQELFVKMIAQPRYAKELGFEYNQRSIDDIRTIVVNQSLTQGMNTTKNDDNSYSTILPPNYWFYIGARVYAKTVNCKADTLMKKVVIAQHDDENEVSPFDRSSFKWRHVNIRFYNEGVKVFTDGSFEITKVCYNYLKHPVKIHNAQDWRGGTYTTLDGTVLTGSQNCELPIGTHSEIVDLAVLLTAGDLALPEYQYKQNKIVLEKQLP
jgi:hypothetical protein